jgi:hypothetical protein
VSYRCGIWEPLASAMGVEPGGPRVTCDTCGTRLVVRDDRMPPRWLLDGKAPPGWLLKRNDDGTRVDTCKTCRKATP